MEWNGIEDRSRMRGREEGVLGVEMMIMIVGHGRRKKSRRRR